MAIVRNPESVMSGVVFVGLAAMFYVQTWELPVGTAVKMGPGYFPLLLSVLLGVLGVIVLASGLRIDGPAPSAMAWRAVLVLTMCILFFGVVMRPLGFLPALAGSVFISTLASRRFRLSTAIAITAVMTVFAWAVFIKGLGLSMQLVGPWLGGY